MLPALQHFELLLSLWLSACSDCHYCWLILGTVRAVSALLRHHHPPDVWLCGPRGSGQLQRSWRVQQSRLQTDLRLGWWVITQLQSFFVIFCYSDRDSASFAIHHTLTGIQHPSLFIIHWRGFSIPRIHHTLTGIQHPSLFIIHWQGFSIPRYSSYIDRDSASFTIHHTLTGIQHPSLFIIHWQGFSIPRYSSYIDRDSA